MSSHTGAGFERREGIRRPAALIASAMLSALACGAPIPPPPSAGGATALPSGAQPETSGGVSPAPTVTAMATPRASLGSPSLEEGVMPGFATGSAVRLIGNEYLALGFTTLNCNALTGWLQARDWLIDAVAERPLPSPDSSGSPIVPRIRWLAISRPGDAAVVRIGSGTDGVGCTATISRLSRQVLAVQGAVTATTPALAFQYVCTSEEPQTVSVATILFGDDGTLAVVGGIVPLSVGAHDLGGDLEVTLGPSELRPRDVITLLSAVDGDAEATMFGHLTTYAPAAGSSATVNVTSVDPLVATIEITDFESEAGSTQTLTAGVRCDLPGHMLTRAAVAPEPTAEPTPASTGHLRLTIGAGDDAIDETVSGPGISCVLFNVDGPEWSLIYASDDPSGLSLSLNVPTGRNPSLVVTLGDVFVNVDPATGGELEVAVDDRGVEVGFTADGQSENGDAVHFEATCRDVSRL